MENTNENRRPGKQPENPRPLPPPQNPPPKCPRCDSINTKFCYYNNYSVSQPRYFCKTCRRYWTHGGALRNVPVGGSCRKGSKKSKAAGALTSSSCGESSTSTQLLPHQQPQPLPGNRNLANLPNSYLSSTGYLSSLAATMQSLSRPQGYNYNQLAFGGGFGGSSSQIRCGSGQFSGGAATSSHSSLLQSFDNQHFRKHQPSNLNHYYFQQQQQHQQQHIYEADPHMLMVQQQNRKQTFILPQNRQIPSNPNSASNSRASVQWAQGMVVQQHQNNLSGPTEHPSMNNPNQWPDGDVEDLHGYGPPSPPS